MHRVSTDDRWCMTDCCIIIGAVAPALVFLSDIQTPLSRADRGPAGSSRADQKNGDRSTMENRVTLARITYSLFPHAVPRYMQCMRSPDGRRIKSSAAFSALRWHRQLERKLIKFIRRFWRCQVFRELAVQRECVTSFALGFYASTKLRKWIEIILGRVMHKKYFIIYMIWNSRTKLYLCRFRRLIRNPEKMWRLQYIETFRGTNDQNWLKKNRIKLLLCYHKHIHISILIFIIQILINWFYITANIMQIYLAIDYQ